MNNQNGLESVRRRKMTQRTEEILAEENRAEEIIVDENHVGENHVGENHLDEKILDENNSYILRYESIISQYNLFTHL